MKCTSNKIVGYWHYGVILTYMSLLSGVLGIVFSAMGMPGVGIICLYISGTCDAFDGAVAKTRKNRTDDDKLFGAQIDSLSDLVAFGVAPIAVGVGMGLTSWYNMIAYGFFVLCAMVRLAYFNVTEESIISDGGKRAYYEGLPVTNITHILPPIYVIVTMFYWQSYYSILADIVISLTFVIVALLYIFRFRMRKMSAKFIAATIATSMVVMTALYIIRYYVCDVHII